MDDECKRLWGSMVNGKMVCFGNDQHGACKVLVLSVTVL